MAVDLKEFRKKYGPAETQQSNPNFRYQAQGGTADMGSLSQFREKYWTGGSSTATDLDQVTVDRNRAWRNAKDAEEKEPAFLTWLKSLGEIGNSVDPYAGYQMDEVSTYNAQNPGVLASRPANLAKPEATAQEKQPVTITPPATPIMSPEQQRAMQFAETKRREGEAARAAQQSSGQIEPGNIDLNNRDTGLYDVNGKLMTVRSITITEDGKAVNIPTVVNYNGRWKALSDEEAIDWYHRTGEHLGRYSTVDEAVAAAEQLHVDQDQMYSDVPEKPIDTTMPAFKLPEEAETYSNGADLQARQTELESARNALQTEYNELSNRVMWGKIGVDYTAEDAENLVEMEKQLADYDEQIKALPKFVDWDGRSALIAELNEIDANAGYITNPDEARATEERRGEIIAELEAGDAAVGNPRMAYTNADRGRATVAGAAGQFASGYLNFAGTALDLLAETPVALGGNVDPYAGYATEDISSGQIGYTPAKASDYADVKGAATAVQAAADSLGAGASAELEKAKGGLGALGQAGVDIAANILQMGFDAAVGALPGVGSLTSMFVRSAGSSAQEARYEGANVFQQAAYGVASGGIEVFTEKMAGIATKIYGPGIGDEVAEEVIRKLTKSDFGRSALRWLSGAASEGFEEVVSDLLAPYAETIYNGKTIGETFTGMFTGSTYDAAEILYDFLIGAAVGGLSGGGTILTGGDAAANYELRMQDAAEDAGVSYDQWRAALDNVVADINSTVAAEDGRGNQAPTTKREAVERRFASEAQERVDGILSGESVSNSKAEQIINDPELAQAFTEMTGVELTGTKSEQRRAVKDAAANYGNIAEDGRGNEQPATKREAVDRQLGVAEQETQTVTDEAAQAEEKPATKVTPKPRAQETTEEAPAQRTTVQVRTDNRKAVMGGIIQNEAEKTGAAISEEERATLAEAFDTNDGVKGRAYAAAVVEAYQLGSEGKVSLEEARRASTKGTTISGEQFERAYELGRKAAQGATLEANLQDLGRYAGEAATVFEDGQDAAAYGSAMTEAVNNYAVQGVDVMPLVQSDRKNGGALGVLTDAQVAKAMEIGQRIRQRNQAAAQRRGEQLAGRKRAGTKQAGRVTYASETGTVGGVSYNAVNKSKLSGTQKAVASIAEGIARFSGLDIRVADFGKGIGGAYVPGAGGVLYLNINASFDGANIAAGSLGHELTHFLQEYASSDYAELKKVIAEEFNKNPEKYREIFGARQATQANLSPDEITDEMAANACQTILADAEAVQNIVDNHKGLAQKIRDFIMRIINDIKAAFSEIDTGSDFTLYQEVRAAEGAMDRIRELWLNAFGVATENLQAEKAEIGSYNLEDFQQATGTDGQPLFQIYAFKHDEQDYRDMLMRWGKMSETQVDELFKLIDTAMAKIEANLEALDYAWEEDINDRAFNPIKQNSDKLYKVSQDFSTLCRKRLLQGLIAGQLSASLQRGLSKEEGIAVRDALLAIQEEGRQIEVACALCYVESARMRSQKAIQEFLNDRAGALQNYFAGKTGKEAVAEAEKAERQKIYEEQGLIRGKGDDATMYDVRDAKTAKMSALPTAIKKRIQDAKKAAKTSYAFTEEQQRIVDEAQSLPVETYTTPEGLQDLAKNHREIFNAFVLKVAAASKSKGIENDTWWRAGDSASIGDTLIEQMNAENGLRTQSWSDFQVKHLMDYIAATIEMSTRGAKQHAYTKVLDYVHLMGNTGVMINMSLIPTREFNGKLEYDDVEGIKHKEAFQLRIDFPDTAGTICIGMDEEQIRMLLESDLIDYVIPYHQSGMSKDTRAKMHIPAWKDYQDFQGEKRLSGDAARENAAKYGVELLSEKDPNWHEPPKFSDWFDLRVAQQEAKLAGKSGKYGVMTGGYTAMRNAAETYKKLCAERGLLPKFSYGRADFSNEPNYWKLLIDRKMVNNVTGDIIEQKPLQPVFDFNTVQRILDEELARYGTVKKDQEEAIQRVTGAFLRGEVKGGMSSEQIRKVMQKPVDNIPITNITQNAPIQLQAWGDGDIYQNRALVSEETLDKWMTGNWYGANDPNYAQAFITSMSPREFLDLTTIYDKGRIYAESEGRTMEWMKEISKGQPIQLDIDTETGQVTGHEGRHRMAVLERAGVREVPVLLFDMGNKYSKQPTDSMLLLGQKLNGHYNISKHTVNDVWPLRRQYREEIVQRYSKQKTSERLLEKSGEQQVRFQKWDGVEGAAVEHFGTTNDFRSAGYMLDDGRLLDFSGRHWSTGGKQEFNGTRYVDHEDVFEAFQEIDPNSPSDSSLQFIKRGNIRVVPEISGLEMFWKKEPSEDQYDKIREYIRAINRNPDRFGGEYFAVDFTKDRTRNDASLRYEGRINADRVINDIKYFYKTGEVREQGLSAFFQTWDQNNLDVSGENRYNIAKTAEDNFGHLMEVLGYDNRESPGGRYGNDGEGQRLQRIEGAYKAASVTSAQTRNELCDEIRRAGGIARKEVDFGYYKATAEVIDRSFYTAEMLYIEQANKERGFGTEFFVGNLVDDIGDPMGLNGFAETDNGISYVRYDAKNARDDTVKSTRKFNAPKLARYEGVQTAAKNNRHERFHLLADFSKDKTALDLVTYIENQNGKFVKTFDDINYWYQVYRPQGGYDFFDYVHEIAADLYAGTLILEDKSIWNEVRKYIDRIDSWHRDTVSPKEAGGVKFQRWDNNDDTKSERSGRSTAYTRLQNENAILKDTVRALKKQGTKLANLQKQLQLTKDPETRQSDARKLAKALITETGSEADVNRIAGEIKNLGDTLLQTDPKTLTEETLKAQARAIAGEILSEAKDTVTLEDEAMDVNPFEAYMSEATEELANRIVMDAMNGVLRPNPPTKADKQKARTKALQEHIQQLKAEQKLTQREAASLYHTIYDLSIALDKAESMYATLRTEADYRAAQIRAEGAARAAEIKARERARANDLLQAQREHYLDMAERAKERREESAGVTKYRKQVEQKAKKLYELLMTNSNDLHVPEVLKAPLGEFLESLDFTSKRSLAGGDSTKADEKFGARLMRIQQMLANQQSYINGDGNIQQDLGGYIDVSPEILDYLRNMAEMITTAMNMGRTFTVNQMTAQDLKTLSDFLGNLRTAIRNMNYFMANARYETVKEAAAADIEEMNRMGRASERANSEVLKFVGWENGTPYYIMKRLGKGAKSLFDGFAKGWERLAFNAQEIINFTEKAYTDKEVREWKKTIHDITLEDGSKIQMTTAQIMELSMLLGRGQALKHISRGGIRIGDIETKKGTKHDTTHYHLSDGDIRAITGLLTPRQAEVAKNLQRYMADRGAEWGNEISMRRFGYKFYEEGPGYYPIKTDANDRPMADTDAQTNSMFRLLNLSASKALNPKASNALIVGDIFDTFADHMADMAKLNGMGLPILDAIKWFNYKERIDHDDGTYDTVTLQGAMEQAFGEQAQRYFRTLMKDINGVNESGDRGTNLPKKLMSNYKIASVAANLRVAFLQPTSYVRAMTVLKPKYMVGIVPTRAAYREAMKYSGTAVWKALGYYETDISRGLREKIAHDDSFRDKFAEASLSLAELGDQTTWSMLWTACKRQAKAESPGIAQEALMEKTAELFREVVYSSQVMDSTLTRSEIMRGKTGWTKAMSAFMAEPTLSYNILMNAVSDLNLDERKLGRAEAWKRNSGKFGKAMTVYVASAAFAAVVESIADAVRDDDDEEFWEKFRQALWGENGPMSGNLSQDLTILGKLPYVKNFISTLQGYTSGDMSVAAFNNLVNVYKIWEETIKLQTGALDKATKVTSYGKMTDWGKVYKTLQALSQMSGFAVSNLTRDVIAIWNTAMNGRRDEWKIRTYNPNALSQSKTEAYEQYVKGAGISKKQYEKILFDANLNGGNVSQDEMGSYLTDALRAKALTKAQATAVWTSLWNSPSSKTYDKWLEGKTKEAAKPKDDAYANYTKNVNIYGKDEAYEGWKNNLQGLGVSLDTFTKTINAANIDGNTSLRQDELGECLYNQIQNKRMTEEEANAWFLVFWNGQRSKTYTKWAEKYHP